jgi:hypothetical protein
VRAAGQQARRRLFGHAMAVRARALRVRWRPSRLAAGGTGARALALALLRSHGGAILARMPAASVTCYARSVWTVAA